jgi:hypothetical protein
MSARWTPSSPWYTTFDGVSLGKFEMEMSGLTGERSAAHAYNYELQVQSSAESPTWQQIANNWRTYPRHDHQIVICLPSLSRDVARPYPSCNRNRADDEAAKVHGDLQVLQRRANHAVLSTLGLQHNPQDNARLIPR